MNTYYKNISKEDLELIHTILKCYVSESSILEYEMQLFKEIKKSKNQLEKMDHREFRIWLVKSTLDIIKNRKRKYFLLSKVINHMEQKSSFDKVMILIHDSLEFREYLQSIFSMQEIQLYQLRIEKKLSLLEISEIQGQSIYIAYRSIIKLNKKIRCKKKYFYDIIK